MSRESTSHILEKWMRVVAPPHVRYCGQLLYHCLNLQKLATPVEVHLACQPLLERLRAGVMPAAYKALFPAFMSPRCSTCILRRVSMLLSLWFPEGMGG